jgi:hypothetical protein
MLKCVCVCVQARFRVRAGGAGSASVLRRICSTCVYLPVYSHLPRIRSPCATLRAGVAALASVLSVCSHWLSRRCAQAEPRLPSIRDLGDMFDPERAPAGASQVASARVQPDVSWTRIRGANGEVKGV